MRLSDDTLTIDEGGTAAYTVVLGSRPTTDVTVRICGDSDTDLICGDSDTDLTLSPRELNFTPDTWDVPQTVIVSAAEDGDTAINAAVELTHMANGGNYTSHTIATTKYGYKPHLAAYGPHLEPIEEPSLMVNITERAQGDETASEARSSSPASGVPTISGSPLVGQTLTASTSKIADADGLTNATFSYQWISSDGSVDTEIQGATDFTYTLSDDDQGKAIRVRVTFTDDAGNEETLTSHAVLGTALTTSNSPATGAPTISGTAQVGETLTANTTGIGDKDGLTDVSYGYQWLADDANIQGATDSSYALADSDQGKAIKVRVSFTDDATNAETLTSAPTVAVAAAPVPLTVSLTVAAPATHDGSAEFTFEIEFSEEFGLSYVTLRDHAFTVAGGVVEKAQRTAKPSNMHWRITVRPDSNADVTITLPITEDCNAEGAICTEDGRKLSNPLKFTVSGPGE